MHRLFEPTAVMQAGTRQQGGSQPVNPKYRFQSRHTLFLERHHKHTDNQSTAIPSQRQRQQHHISIEREAMSSSDIPSLLLQSTDARIAEAAKRVFSSHPIAPSAAMTASAVTCPSTMSSPHYSFMHEREQHYTNKRKAAVDVTACASTESTKHAVVKKRSFDNNSKPTTTNVDEQFELEEDKKLSSTERLQRR